MLLRWVGGKSALAEQIISTFPPHKRYIEPFFGAGWVFFKKQPAKESVINDINNNLINLYEVVRDRPHDISRLIYFTPKSEAVLEAQLAIYNDAEAWARLDKVQRAFIFYYLVKNSFNGLLKSYSTFSTGWNGSGILETLASVSERLRNTDILNRDWKEVLDAYATAETLVYLDPPYAVTISDKDYYYQYILSEKRHEEMREYLVSRKHDFLFVISYDIHEFVTKLYTDIPGVFLNKTSEMFQSSINKNAGVRQDRSEAYKSEYLITNFPLQESLPLFSGI